MRFLYFDRVTHLERGKIIRGTKTFPLSEEYLNRHFTREPVVPGVILIEAMSQLTGWLVAYSLDFKMNCVISLIDDIEAPTVLRPGETVEIVGEIVDMNKKASLCRAWIEKGGESLARGGRLLYPHFPNPRPDVLAERFRLYAGRGSLENGGGASAGEAP